MNVPLGEAPAENKVTACRPEITHALPGSKAQKPTNLWLSWASRGSTPYHGDLSRFLFLIITLASLVSPGRGAELNVGKKVVYPGGADQPPREKDVGVKLKVDPISATIGSGESKSEREERLNSLWEEGNAETILELTEHRNDASSQGFRALALNQLGRLTEAARAARAAQKNGDLPDDLMDEMQKIIEDENAVPPQSVGSTTMPVSEASPSFSPKQP